MLSCSYHNDFTMSKLASILLFLILICDVHNKKTHILGFTISQPDCKYKVTLGGIPEYQHTSFLELLCCYTGRKTNCRAFIIVHNKRTCS